MPRRALLVVDVQNDFLPLNGSLAVPHGDQILPYIYELLEHAEQYDVVVASMDWHPIGHVSFASTHSRTPFTEINVPKLHAPGQTTPQMLWPEHCVQETHGSRIEEGVQTRLDAIDSERVMHIRKGTHTDVDAYSAFSDNEYTVFTALAKFLYQHGISEVDIVGLALDYCVKNTVIDSCKFGFTTRLLRKGTKPVDPASEEGILKDLQRYWNVEVVE